MMGRSIIGRVALTATTLVCATIAPPALSQTLSSKSPPDNLNRREGLPVETKQIPVPVEGASYHVPVFSNDVATVMRVYIPAGRYSDYHTHDAEQVSVVVEPYAPESFSQKLGETTAMVRGNITPGHTGYYSYPPPLIHRAGNPGKLPAHIIVTTLKKRTPAGFKTLARDVAGYLQEFDNSLARAWRLQLKPGGTAPEITQVAPALRIVIDNDAEIAEISPGKRDRYIYLRKGDVYWLDPGQTRAIKNVGSTPLHLAEVEFK